MERKSVCVGVAGGGEGFSKTFALRSNRCTVGTAMLTCGAVRSPLVVS